MDIKCERVVDLMTLVILAAGMGSRFGGMKQITPVGPSGEFIIDYSCYDAIKAGFDKIVFVIKRENLEVFRETVGHRVEPHVKVEYAFQDMTDIPARVTHSSRQEIASAIILRLSTPMIFTVPKHIR